MLFDYTNTDFEISELTFINSFKFLNDEEKREFEDLFNDGNFQPLVEKYPDHTKLFWMQMITTRENIDESEIQFFLNKNIDINEQMLVTPNINQTPLGYACDKGLLELVELLIKNGSKCNQHGENNLDDLICGDTSMEDIMSGITILTENGCPPIICTVSHETISDCFNAKYNTKLSQLSEKLLQTLKVQEEKEQ